MCYFKSTELLPIDINTQRQHPLDNIDITVSMHLFNLSLDFLRYDKYHIIIIIIKLNE